MQGPGVYVATRDNSAYVIKTWKWVTYSGEIVIIDLGNVFVTVTSHMCRSIPNRPQMIGVAFNLGFSLLFINAIEGWN